MGFSFVGGCSSIHEKGESDVHSSIPHVSTPPASTEAVVRSREDRTVYCTAEIIEIMKRMSPAGGGSDGVDENVDMDRMCGDRVRGCM